MRLLNERQDKMRSNETNTDQRQQTSKDKIKRETKRWKSRNWTEDDMRQDNRDTDKRNTGEKMRRNESGTRKETTSAHSSRQQGRQDCNQHQMIGSPKRPRVDWKRKGEKSERILFERERERKGTLLSLNKTSKRNRPARVPRSPADVDALSWSHHLRMSETTAHTAPRVRREPCECVCVSVADAEAQHCTYARQRGTERARERALSNQTTEPQSLAVAPRQQNEGKEGENSVKQ